MVFERLAVFNNQDSALADEDRFMALLSQLKPQMLGEGERDVNRRFYFPRNHWGFRVEIEQRCIDRFNIYILEKERVTSDEYRSKSMTDLRLSG